MFTNMTHIYLLFDKTETLLGAYLRKSEAYVRLFDIWKSDNMVDDDLYDDDGFEREYWGDSKVDNDWNLYRVPVGAKADVVLDTRFSNDREFSIELPKCYEDIKQAIEQAIRDLKIEELTN